MKIQKILKRLLQLHPKSVDLSLKRIKRLLEDLGNPQKKLRNVIQVVGTNGKHSFCSTLREIFETAGYKVNLNISPSLRKFNERYYFAGNYISDKHLKNLLIEVEKVNQGKNITFHEFICACFFLEASRTKSDVNILESGLFFRLDASNVLEQNIASVVMPIGMDHKDFLKRGTIDEIVYEKCSGLLGESKIFISEQRPDILTKIKNNISKNSSKKIFFNNDYYYKKKQNEYGLPLDNRADYTKSDWVYWTASLGDDTSFRYFGDPMYKFAVETKNRVPMSDWHYTSSGDQRGFQARSVVGGYYIKLLKDKWE